jgi:glycosyltransferase involved in cell wall biosynthesis
MRIGYFYRDLLSPGGMPREIIKLATLQAGQGNKIYAYCYGEEVKSNDDNLYVTSFKRPKSFIGIAPELKKILENNEHDIDVLVIIGGHITCNYMVGRACKFGSIPYVVSPGAAYNPYLLTKRRVLTKIIWRMFFESKLLANAIAVRSYSKTNSKHIQAYFKHENIFILREGVFTDDIPNVVTANHFPPDRVNLLYLGRVDVIGKGIDQLCEAMRLVGAKHSNVTLHIVGPIEVGDELAFKELMQDISPDIIKYHGAINGPEKFSVINSADLFVYPSRHEGIPRSLREVLAIGVPVLVTPDTNMAEDVEEFGAGYAVDCSAQSIAQTIEQFLGNSNRNGLREGALALVSTRYDWDSIAREFETILKAIVKSG